MCSKTKNKIRMSTQENVKPLILDRVVGNRLNEIAMLEKRITENREAISQIHIGLTENKKVQFKKIGEYIRDAAIVEPFFFQTITNEFHVIDSIDPIIAKRLVAMQIGTKDFNISDAPQSYEHYKIINPGLSDIDIINKFDVCSLSSLDEILVTAHDVILDHTYGEGVLINEVEKDGQENLNIGYCELTDETGPHIYVIYLESMGKKSDGKMHYNLRHTKIPCTYKANHYFLLKQS